MKRYILLACLSTLAYAVAAQSSVQVQNKQGQPLADVLIRIESLVSKEKATYWTKGNGKISLNLQLPAVIRLSHPDYEAVQDTLKQEQLKVYTLIEKTSSLQQVVVTGQYEPESAKNAVYSVRSIGNERIQKQAANDLQAVLSQELNIRFSRDNATGNANIQLQGLSGQYVKVLVDGIPMTGRGGTDNAIDLNQIDINNIERVEIVEGPMAVNYGADALAGVINIITKKASQERLGVNLTLHEETVGSEYSWFDEGIHTPSLQVNGRITDNLSGLASIRRYSFGGWVGSGTERNREWYPKEQWLSNAKINYATEDFDLSFSTQYMNETLLNLGEVNNNNPLRDPFSMDESFNAKRWMNQLQFNYQFDDWSLQVAKAFTDYERVSREYQTNLTTNRERLTADENQDTIYYQQAFSRNTLQGPVYESEGFSINAQIGAELAYEAAGGTTLSEGEKGILNTAFFASTELAIADRLKIRPGLRYTVNTVFSTIPTPALNLKYDVSETIQLRFGYGRGYRAPSTRELYHEFIDANHNILGNPDLEPENSHNFNGDLQYALNNKNELSVSAFYNTIENMITYFIPQQATAATSYRNLERFRTSGLNLRWKYSFRNLSSNAGFSLIGRYQRLSEKFTVNEMLYSPEANINLSYQFEKPGISTSIFYKFTGANQAFREVRNEEGESAVELQQMNAFHWLDLTFSKAFSNDLSVSTGIKNLTNISSIQNSFTGGGAHSGNNNGQTAMAYGRSYFLRINYKFSK